MSLVSLQSKTNQGQPYLYTTHFPQPIELKPHSQVCVLKFLHYRNTTGYSVQASNNTLKFLLGDTRFDAIRTVILDEGEYTGDQLATQLQTKLNGAKQQFNYDFVVDFTQADSTISPPTNDSFEISYTNIVIPVDPSGGIYTASEYTGFVSGTGYETDTLATYKNRSVEPSGEEGDEGHSLVATRGVVTHLGEYVLEGISFRETAWNGTTITPSFSDYAFGVIRDSLSKFNTGNPNLDFTYRHGQSGVKFDSSGFEFFTVTGKDGAKLGDADYVTYKKCRRFGATTIAQIGDDINELAKIKFKFIFTLIGDGDTATPVTKQEGHKFICQLLTSTDGGITYGEVPDDAFGNDAQGNSYVKTSTIGGISYDGLVWISDDPELNDLEDGVTLATINILQTKLAPFRPFIQNYGTEEGAFLEFDLITDITWTGGNILGYTGSNGYDYRIADGGGTIVGYLDAGSTPLEWNVSSTDTDVRTPNGTAVLDLTTDPKEIVWTKGDLTTQTLTTTDTFESDAGPLTMKIGGIFNTADNPVSVSLRQSDDDIKAHKTFYDDKNKFFNVAGSPSGTLVGADLSKQSSLLLGELTDKDKQTYKDAPLFLDTSSTGGTIQQTLGSLESVIVNTTSIGDVIFTSDTKPSKSSKDTTLHISIPELSGVKSYEGGFNSIAKSIAHLPREEIFQLEDNGTLVYISPFENWIDINNTSELKLNSFTTEIRLPDGSLADDLGRTTTLQIKFREDPEKKREKIEERNLERLSSVMRLSVGKNTGS